MGWLKRWARQILDEELHELDVERDLLRVERDNARTQLAEEAGKVVYWRKVARDVEESERHQRAAANGAALLRLETELLNIWDRTAAALEAPGSDQRGRCYKIELHSFGEAKKLAEQLKRERFYPDELEPYPCRDCPTHPAVGRVFHIRHARKSHRGQTIDERTARHAAVPLSTELGDRISSEAREALILKLANDNGPANWRPEPVSHATAPDSTTIMPAVGTVVADGTNETER